MQAEAKPRPPHTQSQSARASNTVFTDDAVPTDDEPYAFEEQS
jgi:hypothetical protein